MSQPAARELLAQGKSIEEVCAATGLKRRTVYYHRSRLNDHDGTFVLQRNVSARVHNKNYDRRNPGSSTHRRRLREFGVSQEDYAKMVAAQSNLCAICGKPEFVKYRDGVRALAVDHCHKTGSIRKLLCSRCNTVLGAVKDDVTLLRLMVAYLEQHKTA